MSNERIYLNDAHKASCEKALDLQAKQSPKSLDESIRQAKSLESQARQRRESDTNSTEPYVPSKNGSSEAA